MNEYIFTSSTNCGEDITVMKIIATDENMALSKAYSYFGGNSRLSIEYFNVLFENMSVEKIFKLFKDFTGQTILYFLRKLISELLMIYRRLTLLSVNKGKLNYEEMYMRYLRNRRAEKAFQD